MKAERLTRRDFLKLAGIASAGSVLAACAPATQQAPQASGETPQATPPSVEKVPITLWGWWDERMKIFDDAGKDLTAKDPTFQMKTEIFPFDDLWTKVYASVPAGTGPTLLKQKVGEYFKMIDKEMLVPYPEDKFPDAWLKEKYPYFNWEAYGRFVTPTGGMGAMLIYNKKMFTEAGLDPASPPKTIDEMIAAAEKLTKRDASGTITVAGFVPGLEFPPLDYLYQQGGNFIKKDGGKIVANFNTPEMEKAYTFLTDIATKYKVWEPGYLDWVTALGTGKAAMALGQAFVLGDIKSTYPDIASDFEIADPPTFSGKAEPYFGSKSEVLMLSVMKNRPEAEYNAAWQYLEYVLKERIDVQYAKIEILVLAPDRKELFDYPKVLENKDLAKLIAVLPKEYDPVQTTAEFQKLTDDVRDQVLLNGMTVKAAVEFGQTELTKLVEAGLLNHAS